MSNWHFLDVNRTVSPRGYVAPSCLFLGLSNHAFQFEMKCIQLLYIFETPTSPLKIGGGLHILESIRFRNRYRLGRA